jgi:hypothetical protein
MVAFQPPWPIVPAHSERFFTAGRNLWSRSPADIVSPLHGAVQKPAPCGYAPGFHNKAASLAVPHQGATPSIKVVVVPSARSISALVEDVLAWPHRLKFLWYATD